MAAAKYDITIEQGSTFRKEITWQDSTGTAINLAGCTAKAQVREDFATAEAALTFTVNIAASEGKITLTSPATTTSGYALPFGVWDLVVTASNGTATRLLEGNVALSPEVSR